MHFHPQWMRQHGPRLHRTHGITIIRTYISCWRSWWWMLVGGAYKEPQHTGRGTWPRVGIRGDFQGQPWQSWSLQKEELELIKRRVRAQEEDYGGKQTTDHKDHVQEFGHNSGAEGNHWIVFNRNMAIRFAFQKCMSSKIKIPWAHVVMFFMTLELCLYFIVTLYKKILFLGFFFFNNFIPFSKTFSNLSSKVKWLTLVSRLYLAPTVLFHHRI